MTPVRKVDFRKRNALPHKGKVLCFYTDGTYLYCEFEKDYPLYRWKDGAWRKV